MRHRIKKIPNLSTKNHLLHSDKSTYFYKKLSYSGLWFQTIPLGLFAFALLLVLGLMIFPIGISKESVYAETIEYPAGENNNVATISFVLNDADIDGSEISTEVIPDDISYISNTLKVTTNNIGKFAIIIQSASDNSNLTNSDNGATIVPIADATTPDGFTNNTWGYTLTDNTTTADTELTYSPLPAFQEEPTVQYTKNSPDDDSYNLKLVFAAKIGSNKPAGHYKTTALVSVVAEAKELTTYSVTYNGNGNTGGTIPATQTANSAAYTYQFPAATQGTLIKTGYHFLGWAENANATTAQYTIESQITLTKDVPNKTLYAIWEKIIFNDITTMQQMTSDICNGADEGDSKKLIDTRDNKSYEVTKLKGTAGCWMTQNMDNATGRTYHHNTYGGYYSWENAKNICDFSNWQLPTQTQYNTLLSEYGISNNSSGSVILRKTPLNFQYAGCYITGSNPMLYYEGKDGRYWSSTPKNNNAYGLAFEDTFVAMTDDGISVGYSVRCVAK